MSEIKKCFVSRYGSTGRLVEVDLSQIEVVCQAYLSQDKNMIQDIRNGVDFHCKRLAYKLKKDYDYVYKMVHVLKSEPYILQRKQAKAISFAKSYGAGVRSVAKSTGMHINAVKEFYIAEDNMYPGVVEFNTRNIAEVISSARFTGLKSPLGYPIREGSLLMDYGKLYTFLEEDIQAQGKVPMMKKVSFPATKIKNYPVQGLAADLFRLGLGHVFRGMMSDHELSKEARLVNGVHDSILIDCEEMVVNKVSTLVTKIFSRLPELFKLHYGIEFNVPIKADVKVGTNWGEL